MSSERVVLSAPSREIIPVGIFELFRELIRRSAGIHLASYKNAFLANRLRQRMVSLEIDSFEEYWHYLMCEGGEEELQILLDLVTTNVTSFFRENSQFEFIQSTLLPRLVARAAAGGERRIRAWSAACSSGEEPFSIAMTLMEGLPSARSWDVKILASDISVRMLERAADGIYPVETVSELSSCRRHFFEQSGRTCRVMPVLSDLVVLKRINLASGRLPVKAQFDMIFCRNVMIYFDKPTQRRVLAELVSHLKEDGYLFMGHAESLRRHADLVEFVQPTIYRKRREKQEDDDAA